MKVGNLSSITHLFSHNSSFKKSASLLRKPVLNIAFISFIQIDLSKAVIYFVGAIIRRLRHFYIQVTKYFLGHQRSLIRHIPVPSPSGSIQWSYLVIFGKVLLIVA